MNVKWDPNNRAQQMALSNRVAALQTESLRHKAQIETLGLLVKALATEAGNRTVQAAVEAMLAAAKDEPVPAVGDQALPSAQQGGPGHDR